MTIRWNSRLGGLYRIEFSDDLIQWMELDDGVPGDAGFTEFTHTFGSAGAVTRRYYRVTRQ